LHLLPAIEVARKGCSFFQYLTSVSWSIPEAVFRNDGLNLTEALFFALYVKDNPSVVPAYFEAI